LTGFGYAWPSERLGWGRIPALCTVALVAGIIALLPLTWAALAVVASAWLVVVLIHPQLAVLLLVPAIPFGSLVQVGVGGVSADLADVLVALALAAWLMRKIARREMPRGQPALVLPLLLLLGVMLLSVLNAATLLSSLKEIIKWLQVLVIYWISSVEMHGWWRKAVVAVVLATGTVVALQGIYQFLFQVGPEGFVLFGRFMRAYGTFAQPNPYGGYLGLTLPLAAGLILAALLRVDSRVAWRWVVLAVPSGLAMLLALVMSWSRGAWLGCAAGFGIMAAASLVRRGRVAILAVASALLVGYSLLSGGVSGLSPDMTQRFLDFAPYLEVRDVRGVEITDANFAVLERMAHWQAAVGMWTDHPFLGVGIGNYESAYPRYALPLWSLPLGHAHNYYLNIAAEAGILGLAVYLLLWILAFHKAWLAVRHSAGWEMGLALGVLAVLVHLSVHNLFDNLYVHAMYLHVAILLGIVVPYVGYECVAS
jgi:putative inorganic carbon (hco3(-)) transporter